MLKFEQKKLIEMDITVSGMMAMLKDIAAIDPDTVLKSEIYGDAVVIKIPADIKASFEGGKADLKIKYLAKPVIEGAIQCIE